MSDKPWPYRISCSKCDKIIQAPTRDEMPHSICPHCGEDYHYYDSPSPDDGVGVAVEPQPKSSADIHDEAVKANRIPIWACRDIDQWQAHLMNADEEEAEGSHEYFNLIAWHGNRVVLTGREVDILVVLEARDGLVFIDTYGEDTSTHYVGIMEGFHEVYVAHKA